MHEDLGRGGLCSEETTNLSLVLTMADTHVVQIKSQGSLSPWTWASDFNRTCFSGQREGKRGAVTDGKPTLLATHGTRSLWGQCASAVVTKDSTGAG